MTPIWERTGSTVQACDRHGNQRAAIGSVCEPMTENGGWAPPATAPSVVAVAVKFPGSLSHPDAKMPSTLLSADEAER